MSQMGTKEPGLGARQDDETFWREWTWPEEDRHLYTSELWRGEWRWFRSPNVICLETWRRKQRPPA
jgi:hypothetical protein